MEYRNRLKGAVTQALLKTLLADAGYRIVPLGIEEVIREVTQLSRQKYLALGLPTILRKMPDFFVASAEINNAWLVEVKYRKRWSACTKKSLEKELIEQVKKWGPLCLILFLGNPARTEYPHQPEQPSSWMAAFLLKAEDNQLVVLKRDGCSRCKWADVSWKDVRIQDIFTELRGKEPWKQQTLEQTKTLLMELKKLDVFD